MEEEQAAIDNLSLYNKVREVPQEAKKGITGGRLNGMTDINPMWRIKTLTEQFGVCGFGWKTSIQKMWIECGANDEKMAFCHIALYVKIDGIWSEPIDGIGGSSFVAKEKNGMFTSDECFKMAYTDAISVACKAIGVGADVYYAKDRTKYDQQKAEPKDEKPKDYQVAKDEVAKATTIEELQSVWINWKALQGDAEFKALVNKRKAELQSQES